MNNTCQTTTIEGGHSLPLLGLPKDQLVLDSDQPNTGCFSSCPDILSHIFLQCVGNGDKTTLLNLRTLNKFHHKIYTEFANQKISLTGLFNHCGKIEFLDLDREAFHFVKALPKILCTNFDALNDVENEAGGVAFYYEELTMDELVAWGQQMGVQVDVTNEMLVEDRTLLKEEPQICIATQGIFKGSRNKRPKELKKDVEVDHGCQMLTARKAIYITLRALKTSKGKKCLFGQVPMTYTYTSTAYGNSSNGSLLIGGCASTRLRVGCHIIAREYYGAGGQWAFGVGHSK